ncbi:MAG: TraR/DksA C4-type zinc finger protein [Candidatus Margulisbacteria bacterium]|nr:TraR/DksA C4-type zinc finger protein [Candidatus Margulisiibacteriota bacterium]
MKKTELKKYEQLLLAKRKEMLDGIEDLRKESTKTIKDATGELSSHTYHMADLGTDAQEREKKFQLASKSGRLVYHIDEALRRIKEGTYGKCTECGKEIKAARLLAVPHARLCIDCKEKEEKEKARRQ